MKKSIMFLTSMLLSLPLCTASGQTAEKVIRTVHVDEGSSLESLVGDDETPIDSLIVTGFLHHSDFPVLNWMCHAHGISGINMSDCKVENDSIPNNAFYDLRVGITESLEYFTFPRDLRSIGMGAFSYTNLCTIDFPPTLRSLGPDCFRHMKNLKGTLRFPDGIRELPSYCFTGAVGIEAVVLPSTLERLDDCCLFEFPNLREIELPEGLKSIGTQVFSNMGITQLRIPESVVEIDHAAFSRCFSLEEVWLPSSMKEIPSEMFQSCHGLKTVHMPDGLESISDRAFLEAGFPGLLFLSDNIRHIGSSAFEYTEMSGVVLPATLEEISPGAFCRHSHLHEVYSKSMTPARVVGEGDKPIFSSLQPMTLYVPRGAKPAYESDPNWQMFSEIVEVDEFPTAIGSVRVDAAASAWYGCDGKQLSAPVKGLNIVKMADGTVKKVIVR